MLAAVGPALETKLGPGRLTALFMGFGVVGYLGAVGYARSLTDREMWTAAAKFQEGYGCSPSTYGLAIVASWILPSTTVLGWGKGSWLSTAAAVHLLPHICQGKWDAVWHFDIHRLVLTTSLWAIVSGALKIPPVVNPVDW